MNDSYKAILDREYGSQSAQHFKDSVDVLNEVLNYGSQLLPKAIERSPRDVKAVCIIGYFADEREGGAGGFLGHMVRAVHGGIAAREGGL
jgi:hypothetical protein